MVEVISHANGPRMLVTATATGSLVYLTWNQFLVHNQNLYLTLFERGAAACYAAYPHMLYYAQQCSTAILAQHSQALTIDNLTIHLNNFATQNAALQIQLAVATEANEGLNLQVCFFTF